MRRTTPKLRPASSRSTTATLRWWRAADQIQLYKLLTRQIADKMGYTACYLPKPVVGVNGSGMHTNVSVSKGKTNLFWDEKGEEQLSKLGWDFLERILTNALDLCLIFNSSVNAYRRLDPHFEAPNQIRASAVDRGAMIRVPIGNHRSCVPKCAPLPRTPTPTCPLRHLQDRHRRRHLQGGESPRRRTLPARQHPGGHRRFKGSEWIAKILGEDVQARYAELKQAAANRCPSELGAIVKGSEVQFHHAVYNQSLWNLF